MRTIIAGTGHRPTGLYKGSIKTPENVKHLYREELNSRLSENPDLIIVSGMAIGADQLLAEVCVELSIKYVACIPFEGQDSKWTSSDKNNWSELLKKAWQVNLVSLRPPSDYYEAVRMLHQRNQYMVDLSDSVIALFNGVKKGGTYNVIDYAERKNKRIVNIWPKEDYIFPPSTVSKYEHPF